MQKFLEKMVTEKQIKDKCGYGAKRDIDKWKAQFREGIPDPLKRKAILEFFEINEDQARTQYETVKKLSGEEF